VADVYAIPGIICQREGRQFESGLVLHRKRSPAKCFCLAGLFRLDVPHNSVPHNFPHYSRAIGGGGGTNTKGDGEPRSWNLTAMARTTLLLIHNKQVPRTRALLGRGSPTAHLQIMRATACWMTLTDTEAPPDLVRYTLGLPAQSETVGSRTTPQQGVSSDPAEVVRRRKPCPPAPIANSSKFPSTGDMKTISRPSGNQARKQGWLSHFKV